MSYDLVKSTQSIINTGWVFIVIAFAAIIVFGFMLMQMMFGPWLHARVEPAQEPGLYLTCIIERPAWFKPTQRSCSQPMTYGEAKWYAEN